MPEHFDVIIIGTGAGGGTLLNRIAPSGKRILVLERGPFLPREKDNWSYHGSFKYYSSETMYNKTGGEIHPGFCYHVGGNTKVYGAALFRLSLRFAPLSATRSIPNSPTNSRTNPL
jgi:choline dehydrogenase-like flavoprotein